MKIISLTKLAAPFASVLLMAGLVVGASLPLAQTAFAAGGDCSIDAGMSGAATCAKGKDQPTELFAEGGVFQTVTNVLLFIIGAVSVIMLIIGGIRYTVSQGDQGAVTSAKNTILYAIIGLVVAILAYAAVNFVITSFMSKE